MERPAKREARKDAARAGLEGAIVGYDETLLHLLADVKLAFWTLLSIQQSLQLAKENLAIIQDIRQIIDGRVQLGEARDGLCYRSRRGTTQKETPHQSATGGTQEYRDFRICEMLRAAEREACDEQRHGKPDST